MTLSGPRTIPFLEYHGAREHAGGGGHAPAGRAPRAHDEVILYGHPCYEGVREGVLRQVFARVVEHGFRFVTMQTLAERLQAAHAAR